MTVLETRGLRKTYGSGQTRVDALKHANLVIREGEFVSVVGPSGSGKSTFLHLLGGLDQPSEGTVLVDGSDLYAMSDTRRAVFRRRQIGFVFQFYNLIPVLSAWENITLPLMLDERAVDNEHVSELLRMLGLSERAQHMPNELSGGERQRVSIGRALVARPSIILADEPTGNLDRASGSEILGLLRLAVRTFNQTVVMITHDMDAAAEADRIVSIEDGVLRVWEGEPA